MRRGFEGPLTALVTPFRAHGTLEEALARLGDEERALVERELVKLGLVAS